MIDVLDFIRIATGECTITPSSGRAYNRSACFLLSLAMQIGRESIV